MTKSLIQFDGANFYFRIKTQLPRISLSNFNYRLFVESFVNSSDSTEIRYYVGEVEVKKRSRKIQKLYDGQQKLFSALKSQDIKLQLGYLLKIGRRYHEKGVDVQIAVDMADSAADDLFDSYYLISSDTDLIPGIKAAQRRGKKVIYVTIENIHSNALSKVCNDVLILTKKDVLNSQKDNNRDWLKK